MSDLLTILGWLFVALVLAGVVALAVLPLLKIIGDRWPYYIGWSIIIVSVLMIATCQVPVPT